MVSSTWLIVRAPLTKNWRDFGVYTHSENTYSWQGMPQSPKREVTALPGAGVSPIMNHRRMDPAGALTLHPPAVAAVTLQLPATSLTPAKGQGPGCPPHWTPPPNHSLWFRWFFSLFFNFNFNKAKLIVCEMKKWILKQSYPSDNSSQFATEFPLASATEQGLYFFFQDYFLLLPFPPPHTRETDCMKKPVVK